MLAVVAPERMQVTCYLHEVEQAVCEVAKVAFTQLKPYYPLLLQKLEEDRSVAGGLDIQEVFEVLTSAEFISSLPTVRA